MSPKLFSSHPASEGLIGMSNIEHYLPSPPTGFKCKPRGTVGVGSWREECDGGALLLGNQLPHSWRDGKEREQASSSGQLQCGVSPTRDEAGRPALPCGSWLPASPFQTRSGDPPSAPEASAEVGTLVLAPESDIPEAPRNSLPTLDSWQNRRVGASGRCTGQECEGEGCVGEDCGKGQSEHLSMWEMPGQKQGRPPTQPPGTVHLWLAHPHPNRSLGGVTVQCTKWGTRLRAESQA